jgi:hypothetical protein
MMGALGWQDAIVAIAVLGAVAWLVRRQVARRRKKSCGCEGCPGAEKLAANIRAAQALRKFPPPRR